MSVPNVTPGAKDGADTVKDAAPVAGASPEPVIASTAEPTAEPTAGPFAGVTGEQAAGPSAGPVARPAGGPTAEAVAVAVQAPSVDVSSGAASAAAAPAASEGVSGVMPSAMASGAPDADGGTEQAVSPASAGPLPQIAPADMPCNQPSEAPSLTVEEAPAGDAVPCAAVVDSSLTAGGGVQPEAGVLAGTDMLAGEGEQAGVLSAPEPSSDPGVSPCDGSTAVSSPGAGDGGAGSPDDEGPRRPLWLRWLLRLLLGVLLVVSCAAAYAGFDAWRFLTVPPQDPGVETTFDVEAGTSFDRVARQLEQRGIVTSAWRLKVLGHWKEWTGSLKAGRFAVHTGWTPERVLDQLVNGQPILYRLTLREGLTWWEVGRLVEEEGFAGFADFNAVIHDPAFLRHYGIPFPSAEGFLFPDTYLLKKPQKLDREAARSLAGRLVDNFWRRNVGVLPQGFRTPPDELRRLVTLASIVERETGDPAERARVAGVYVNRLRVGMILQADPTVIYGLGPVFDGNLRRSHLQDATNEYNTYRRPGLPPGPICSPGYEALRAAANPEQHGFFYFVARKDGTHQFSTNLDDHNAAVRKFQLGR